MNVIDSINALIHPNKEIQKKRIKIVDENLPKASRTDLRMKNSNGGSIISKE
jgi:hypothetical protein